MIRSPSRSPGDARQWRGAIRSAALPARRRRVRARHRARGRRRLVATARARPARRHRVARCTTSPDVAALTGADEEELRRLWRAVGFPDVPEASRCSRDADVEAAQRLLNGAFAPRSDFPTMLRHVRVISSSMARVASVLAEYYGDQVRELRDAGRRRRRRSRGRSSRSFDGEELAALLVYAARLQLRARAAGAGSAATRHPTSRSRSGSPTWPGYTQLSAELDSERLAEFVGRWEELRVRHRRAARRAGREDDRRRGDVRRPVGAGRADRDRAA